MIFFSFSRNGQYKRWTQPLVLHQLCVSLDKNKTEVGLKDNKRKDRQQGQRGNTTGVDFCEHEQCSSRSKYVT